MIWVTRQSLILLITDVKLKTYIQLSLLSKPAIVVMKRRSELAVQSVICMSPSSNDYPLHSLAAKASIITLRRVFQPPSLDDSESTSLPCEHHDAQP